MCSSDLSQNVSIDHTVPTNSKAKVTAEKELSKAVNAILAECNNCHNAKRLAGILNKSS